MTKEEIYCVWAPETSEWSKWAKPVLFANMSSRLMSAGRVRLPGIEWAPAPSENYALVLDLPGDEGVWIGVALALRGYRPVPLYNALPLPFDAPILDIAGRPVAAIDMMPILLALQQSAPQLAQATLPSGAPPCFLLDARRHGDGLNVLPEQFDNRSISFTTDFPSAAFLRTHGVRRVLLVQRERAEPQADLAQTLLCWQEEQLPLERMPIENPVNRQLFRITRPSWFRRMFQRMLAEWRSQCVPKEGFGKWMPDSSSGG